MKTFNHAANAAQQTPFASNFTIKVAIILFMALFMGIILPLSAASYSNMPKMQLPVTQSIETADVLLEGAVSSQAYAQIQLDITSEEGFEGCTAEVIINPGGQVATFFLNVPSNSALPANADIGTFQVIDPDDQSQQNYKVETGGGGVMIIMVDM